MQILGFCLALFFLASGCYAQKPKECNISYRCADNVAPVWTTSDNLTCQVFRNACLFNSENCNRANEYKPKYKRIAKAKCQKLCGDMMCLAVYQPVCGSFKGKLKTFGNYCEMKKYICTTGETYTLYSEAACPEYVILT